MSPIWNCIKHGTRRERCCPRSALAQWSVRAEKPGTDVFENAVRAALAAAADLSTVATAGKARRSKKAKGIEVMK